MSSVVLDSPPPMAIKDETTGENIKREEERTLPDVVHVYRDPEDVLALRRKDTINFALGLVCVLLSVASIYLYMRRPEMLIVNSATGRVVATGERNFGESETVRLSPDAPTFEDEKYLVTTYLTYLYRVDLTSRKGDLESALRLMLPASATALSQFMTQNGVLQTQFEQQWSADFTVEHIERVPGKNLSVQAIGRQNITKVVNGQAVKESKQLLMTVDLLVDKPDFTGGPRRKDRNLRTGFVVERLDVKDINPSEANKTMPTDVK